VSSTAPGALLYVRANISGARLDPPIPGRTAWVNPSAATCLANACSPGILARRSAGSVSHPSRLVTSVGSGFQTVWSWLQTRATTSSVSISFSRRRTAGASEPRDCSSTCCSDAMVILLVGVGRRFVPVGDDRPGVFVAEDADAGRVQGEEAAILRRHVEPAGREDPEDMAVG